MGTLAVWWLTRCHGLRKHDDMQFRWRDMVWNRAVANKRRVLSRRLSLKRERLPNGPWDSQANVKLLGRLGACLLQPQTSHRTGQLTPGSH